MAGRCTLYADMMIMASQDFKSSNQKQFEMMFHPKSVLQSGSILSLLRELPRWSDISPQHSIALMAPVTLEQYIHRALPVDQIGHPYTWFST